MKLFIRSVVGLLFLVALTVSLSCAKKADTAATATPQGGGGDGGGGGSGGGSTFTAAQIVKTWSSDCTASTDAILGSTYYKDSLTLNSNGTFNFQHYMYTNPNPGGQPLCGNLNYFTIFSVAGTYSVGAVVSGSLQSLTFTVDVSGNVPSLMVVETHSGGTYYTPTIIATQDAFNNDCGGTSPYCTLVASSCTNNGVADGHGVDSQHMNCMHYTFPNTGTNTIYNVGTYDGSTLTLGASTTGVPGVFSPGAVAGSATVAYH